MTNKEKHPNANVFLADEYVNKSTPLTRAFATAKDEGCIVNMRYWIYPWPRMRRGEGFKGGKVKGYTHPQYRAHGSAVVHEEDRNE